MEIIMEKYHGLGNDYLVIDPYKNNIELNEENIKLICNRNYGVGSDGILYGPIFDSGKIKVKIYNPDGSEAEKSGNGVRIFSRYLLDEGYVNGKTFILTTLGGDVEVEYMNKEGSMLKVAMGKVTFKSDDIPVTGYTREVINEEMKFNGVYYNATCLSIGNPHCVIILDNISEKLVKEIGPFVENAEYFPNRINLQIVKVIDRNNIKIEIYERGAGYTLASGSSSCAAASAVYKLGLIDKKVNVHMPGGVLNIEIMKDGMIYMIGPVMKIGSIKVAEQFMKNWMNSSEHRANIL